MNILDARCPVVMLSSLFVLPSLFLLFMDVHKMNLAKNLPQCSFLCVCCMTVFFLHFDIALENDFSSDLVICHGLERVFAHVYHDVSSFETTHRESSPVCANKM